MCQDLLIRKRSALIATTHLAAGAAVGAVVFRVLKPQSLPESAISLTVACIMGILSHFLLDAVPHNEFYHRLGKYFLPLFVLELVLTFVAVFGPAFYRGGFDYRWFLSVLIGMSGGALPDLAWMIKRLFKIDFFIVDFIAKANSWFHSNQQVDLGWSMSLQMSLVLIFLCILHLKT